MIHGGAGNDYIEGRGKADTIYGGTGNDTVVGGAGADMIYGEDGDDVLDVSPHALFRDTVDGGAGANWYNVDADDVVLETVGDQQYEREGVRYALSAGRLVVTGTSAADRIWITERGGILWLDSWSWAIPNSDAISEILVDSGDGDDWIDLRVSHRINTTVHGGDGDDTIRLGAGHDLAYGGAGNDRIYGGEGDDSLYGGGGNDLLHGDAGADRLYGEHGDDDLLGGTGDDYLDGGPGWYDHLNGGASSVGAPMHDPGDVIVR